VSFGALTGAIFAGPSVPFIDCIASGDGLRKSDGDHNIDEYVIVRYAGGYGCLAMSLQYSHPWVWPFEREVFNICISRVSQAPAHGLREAAAWHNCAAFCAGLLLSDSDYNQL
jgi:hypothetical protein